MCPLATGPATSAQQRIQVESKRDLKDRLGEDASPDRADTIVMGCSGLPTRNPAGGGDMTDDEIMAGEDRPQMEMDL